MNLTALQRHSLKTRITFTVLLIFLACLWSLSYYASKMLRKDMERLLGQQQFSTVSFLAGNLNRELDDRVAVLQIVAATVTPAILGSKAAAQKLLNELPIFQRHFNGGVMLYRVDGTPVAQAPRSDERIGLHDFDRVSIDAALKTGKPTIGRPFKSGKLLAPAFGMTVPIHNAQGQVIGALSGVTDLGKPNFMSLITEHHYSQTGGYLLVAPQHRLVITASDRSRIMQALPARGINPLLDRFIESDGSTTVMVNPVGVTVLVSHKRIPAADWIMAVSLPISEAFSPIYAMQQRVLISTLVLSLLAGGLTWWLLRRQLAPLLATARTLTRLSASNQPIQPLPVTRKDEIGQLIAGFNHLLATLAQREQERRIAAIAFECQEGMIVTDANQVILRTNQSFTRIMGYTNEEVVGKTTAFMHSDRHPPAFYDAAWQAAQKDGAWQAEVWHQRKNGEVFAQWLTSTAVKDEHGAITHFVVTHIDITHQKKQEQQRLLEEAAHRNLLVREVHHRIKNNLQGITGLLRQFARKHPETADPINQAVGQVQSISIIHGLQGRAMTSLVQLCELTLAIAEEIEKLWQTPVSVDIPPNWTPCTIAENEAVPVALVLHELMVNAVKHGGQAHKRVDITIRQGANPEILQIRIVNTGVLDSDNQQTDASHSGLQLISALMPRSGATLIREQHGTQVVTLLELGPPVVFPTQIKIT